MLTLLAAPQTSGQQFKPQFMALYDEAGRLAYPLAWSLLDEHHAINSITR